MAHAISLNDYALPNRSIGLFARLSRALAQYRTFRTVQDELDALSDRELADLGITRLNIREIAREAFDR